MAELLSAIGTLAIIVIGMMVLLEVISVQDAFHFIGRALLLLVLAVLALCVLKGFWVRVLFPWLVTTVESLKAFLGWLLIAIVVLAAVAIIIRLVLRHDE